MRIMAIWKAETAASLQPQRPWKPSHSAGGYDFPRNPLEPADRESIFWIPSLQPEAVLLSTTSPARGSAAVLVDLTHLPGLDLRPADYGWHAVFPRAGILHQFSPRQMPSY